MHGRSSVVSVDANTVKGTERSNSAHCTLTGFRNILLPIKKERDLQFYLLCHLSTNKAYIHYVSAASCQRLQQWIPSYLLIMHGLSASYELHITRKFALPILHVQKLPYKV